LQLAGRNILPPIFRRTPDPQILVSFPRTSAFTGAFFKEGHKMLVLSRKRGQGIVIGNGVTVTILDVQGERVKLGFAAPAEVPIHREEIHRQIEGRLPILTHAAGV
jgi:carbon storage regulator